MKTHLKFTILKVCALIIVGSFFDDVVPLELLKDPEPLPAPINTPVVSSSGPKVLLSGYKIDVQLSPPNYSEEPAGHVRNRRSIVPSCKPVPPSCQAEQPRLD